METKVKIIERVEQRKKMVNIAHSYKMKYSNIDTILKNGVQDHRTCAVCCGYDANNNIEKWEKSDGDGETSQSLIVAPASSPTQLHADSRES